jgi:uncharacterized protein YjbJ (UPF0337 family)
MVKTRSPKDEIAGKAKQVAGEILGDQKLHDKGKAQEQKKRDETDGATEFKPLGNLDQLT